MISKREIRVAPVPVYAYDKSINDFSIFSSEQVWKDHLDVDGAISYLTNHLQQSLKDDFYPAYDAYNPQKGGKGGFFALPRIIFPYITFLGTLYKGYDFSKNAVHYMNKYMSRVNQVYEDEELCDFIYRVYRHGLIHTNMPKVVSENGKVIGWVITFDDSKHLNVERTPSISGKTALLSISPKRLAEEVILSIDVYNQDLQDGVASLDKFKKGFLSMSRTSHNGLIIPQYLKNDNSN